MKAAIYNPYFDSLGGGERYSLAFAEALVSLGYRVYLQWDDVQIEEKLEKRFGRKLTGINIVKDIKRGDGYDVCFWVSDGSIPTLKSRKNILHFQVPFTDVNGKSLLNRMKLFRINNIVCNSNFTKKFIDKEYGVKSIVLYPPVDTSNIKPKRKRNIIFYVGRFSKLKQSKNQDILVKAFKKLYDSGIKDWKLVLAGGTEVGSGDFVNQIKKYAKDYPTEILKSPDFKTISDLYGKAKIFWSASGYGEDENKNPEKVEHFGITVVEAMAAGAVPVVFSAGGHREIIKDNKNGFLWKEIDNLVSITKILIRDNKLLRKLAKKTIHDAEKFGYERFKKQVVGLF